jgi:hypothetical protein
MKPHIRDEKTGLEYELTGDFYLIAGDDDPPPRPIGIWGRRRLDHLKTHRQTLYTSLLLSGKLNDHLADLNEEATAMAARLVRELAQREGVDERLKAADPLSWVGRMNSIRARVREMVYAELIYP